MDEKDILLDTVGNFTYCNGHDWFIETDCGNYYWSDPQYPGGDNTITKFNGSFKSFLEYIHEPYGRAKGQHIIGEYCGNGVKVNPIALNPW